MKKLLIILLIPPILGACGRTANGPSNDSAVGTWKVDIADTTIQVPNDEVKQQEESMRVSLNADGTFSITGKKQPESGKWVRSDHELILTPDVVGGSPLQFTQSDDGSKLTLSMDGKSQVMVLVKT